MNVMILGAGGPVGNALADALEQTDHQVLNVSRRGEGSGSGLWRQGDRANPVSILSLIKEHKVDALIDMVGYHLTPSEALLIALEGYLQTYVFISSGDVYRNFGLLHRLEKGTPDIGPLREDAPLRTCLYPYNLTEPRLADDPLKWQDQYDKIPIEAAVQRLHTEWIICRLPMVYGRHVSLDRFSWARQTVSAMPEKIEFPKDWLGWVTTLGFIENVAAAIVHLLEEKRARRQVFNIVDTPAQSNQGWLMAISEIMDWSGDIIGIDDPAHPISQMTDKLDLSVPLDLSGEKLLREFGFNPPVSFQQSLEAILA